MATITPPDRSATAGIPQQWSDDIAVTAEGFIVGDTPPVFTEDMTVALSQTFVARQAVGLDGSGNLIPAVLGTTAAIGFTVAAITTPGSGALKSIPVYRGGVFNPALAVWDATYNTAEKKLEAFRGAASPTAIVMRPVKTATVVLP